MSAREERPPPRARIPAIGPAGGPAMRRRRRVPANFFGIPLGLIGLADAWLVAANFHLAPVLAGRLLVAVAMFAWVAVTFAYLRGLLTHRVSLAGDLADPVAGPFIAAAVLVPMLAAADVLHPYDHRAGTVLVDVLIAITVVLAGWFTGQWTSRPVPLATVHPGYFLPAAAGGFISSACAALVGQRNLAQVLFGLGLFSWIVLGAIIRARPILGPPLPTPLVPTLAIEVAPAAVAIFAAFVIDGQHVNVTVQALAGYGLLMVIAQLRLLPEFLRLSFMPTFWAFTFPAAAVDFAALFWLGITHPTGWRTESYLTLAAITVLVGAIAARTVLDLHRGHMLASTVAPAITGTVPATEAIAIR
ncbi:MAG TPA: hypothetical protein VHV82_22945 [Sporichthyaceae bacterium]|jgi:tellurite resistance protein|nr:hypothetical protein [Sporichthyaceae bacterium]